MSEILLESHLYRSSIQPSEKGITSPYERIALYAESLQGKPSQKYRGPELGTNPEEWVDCSGFVTHVLRETGITIPEGIRHCNEYFDRFGMTVHAGRHSRGDLIFFSGNGGISPTHMGIVLTPDSYIHAPGKNDTFVTLASIQEEKIDSPADMHYYHTNPIGFKRIVQKEGRYQYELSHQIFPKP